MTAPAGATTLTLRNDDKRSLPVQIRVFRWSQAAGTERLDPTTDVVASPPMVHLSSGMEYVVRIVRVTKRPISSEESYRVLVDEIPSPSARANGTIAFVLRYSVPVFFTPAAAPQPNVAWSIMPRGSALLLTAANTGGHRLRVANLKLLDVRGTVVLQRDGLIGYVLPGAVMSWPLPGKPGAISKDSEIKLIADSESGPVHASFMLRPTR